MPSTNELQTLAIEAIATCVIDPDDSSFYRETIYRTGPNNLRSRVTCIVKMTYFHPINAPDFDIEKFQQQLNHIAESRNLHYVSKPNDRYNFSCVKANKRHEIQIVLKRSQENVT